MNKGTKIVVVLFVVFVVAAVPLYFYLHSGGEQEGTLQIKGLVSNPYNLTISELRALPSSNIEVTLDSSTHLDEEGTFTYTGVTLWSLLESADVSVDASSVYVKAIDGYGLTLRLTDVQHDSSVLLVYEKDGQPLVALADGGEGPIRLVIGSDQYAQRWVKSVVALDVR
ncbi:MAG: molybdopterin-dependent oxidoreductase [Candidatus Bathyarchaeia archaeon]|jgi:DMSO/TMAO reductase YedYZ molybdopterin-dependent catalytic subunit